MLENRKKKITAGVGVAAIAIAVIGLTAGTYAGFSDSEESSITNADVATLDLTDNSLLSTVSNLVPGVTNEVLGTLSYTNDGSVDGSLQAVIPVTGNEGLICEVPLLNDLGVQIVDPILGPLVEVVEGVVCDTSQVVNDLIHNLQLTFNVIDDANVTSVTAPLADLVSNLTDPSGNIVLDLGVLAPGDTVTIEILGTIASNVTNIIQGDTLGLESIATLTQA